MINKYETLFKRFLKNKIRICTATIVAICISGSAFGATTPIKPTGNNNTENVIITAATTNPTGTVGEGYIHFNDIGDVTNSGSINAQFLGGQYSRNIYGLTTTSSYSPLNTVNNSANILINAVSNQESKPDGTAWGNLDIRGISTKGSVKNIGDITLSLNNIGSRTAILMAGIVGSDGQTTGNTQNNGNVTVTLNNSGLISSSAPTSSASGTSIIGIKGKNVNNNKSVVVSVNNSGNLVNTPSSGSTIVVAGLQASSTTFNDGVVSVNYNNSGNISGTSKENIAGIYLTGNATGTNNGILEVNYSSNTGEEAHAIKVEDWNGKINTDDSKGVNNGIVVVSGNVNVDNIKNDGGMIYNKDTGIVTSAGNVIEEGKDKTLSANDLKNSQTVNKFSLNLTSGISNDAQINAISSDSALINILADQDVVLNNTKILAYAPGATKSNVSALITTETGSTLEINGSDITTSAQNAIYAFGDEITVGAGTTLNATYAVKLSDNVSSNTEYRKVKIDSKSNINGILAGGINSNDALILSKTEANTGNLHIEESNFDGTILNAVENFEALVVESGNWEVKSSINLDAHNANDMTDTFIANGDLIIGEGGTLNLEIDADNKLGSSVYANSVKVENGGKLNIDIKGSTLISKETTIDLAILNVKPSNIENDSSSGDIVQNAMDKAIADGLVSTTILGTPSWQDTLYGLNYKWAFEDGQLKLKLIQANGPTLVGGYNTSVNKYPQSNVDEIATDLIDSKGSKLFRNSKINSMITGKSQQPIFAEILGMTGDYTGNSQDYKYSATGVLVGGVKEITKNLTLGATFGQMSSDVDYKDGVTIGTNTRDSNEDVSSYAFNAYLSYNYNNWLGTIKAGMSNNEHELNRKAMDTDNNNDLRVLTSKFDSDIQKIGAELGYVKSFGKSSFVYPYAALEHLSIKRDAYKEQKTENTYLDMAFKENEFETGRGVLGLNLQTKFTDWKWSADIAYISNFSSREASDANFQDVGDIYFSVPELAVGKNTVKATIGFDCNWTEAFSITGAYEFSSNSSYTNNGVSLGAKYLF
ncbi:autotransporter domain-containing protein [Cetobacterium sp.]|uniref:autotransporter family protein n=1 Tax=Cetobacterium sp. TaxID=2071632 RepID=UPI003F2C19D8